LGNFGRAVAFVGGCRGSGAAAAAAITCAFLATACGAAAPIVAPGGPGTVEHASAGEHDWARAVLDLTNAVRAEHGLHPLILDDAASRAAYEHCWDMDLRDYFAHLNPDGEGASQRMGRHGLACQIVGENLARGHSSPQDVLRRWMESPSHRANILYPSWTHVGVAVHSGGDTGPWWAQLFYR
jgi:uncharacterized protein YkwD